MKIDAIIEKGQLYWSKLLRSRLRIAAGGLVIGLLLGIWAWRQPLVYTAKTVFHPEENGGMNMQDLSNPLSILMGGGGMSASTQQMVKVLNSRRVNEAVVSDSMFIDSSQVLIADAVLDAAPKKLSVGRVISWFFPSDSVPPAWKRINSAADLLMKQISTESGEEGFLTFSLSFYDDTIAIELADRYVQKLEEYYLSRKTQRGKESVRFFSERVDSVKQELDKATRSLARTIDQDQYRIFAQDQIRIAEMEAQVEILKNIYVQLVASREAAVAQLKRETPIIQVLDRPDPPLKGKKPSTLINLILGGILGGFLAALWVTRSLWREDLWQVIKSSLEGNHEQEQGESEKETL